MILRNVKIIFHQHFTKVCKYTVDSVVFWHFSCHRESSKKFMRVLSREIFKMNSHWILVESFLHAPQLSASQKRYFLKANSTGNNAMWPLENILKSLYDQYIFYRQIETSASGRDSRWRREYTSTNRPKSKQMNLIFSGLIKRTNFA